MKKSAHPGKDRGAFSLIELLVTAALAAATITAAVMIYQSFTASRGTRSTYDTVTVGAALHDFYGGNATSISAYYAPNYGRSALAESLREQFLTDIQSASAVFCLGRNGTNTIHPSTITVSTSFRGDSLDMPDTFRALIDSAAAVFTPYRGASYATNASIYILKPSENAATLSVLSIYDVDLTPATSPSGTYASVKRYAGATLTDYYDVFYPASGGTVAFNPLVVCFERSARRVHVEGASIDRLKQAAERPFYFVWWPDPAEPSLEAFADSSIDPPDAGDPRASYPHMGGRTAFFMVVPMFPAL